MFYTSEDAVRLIEMTPLEGDRHVTEGLQSEIGGRGERCESEGEGGVRVGEVQSGRQV